MAEDTSPNVSYRKLDPDKLSFFDLCLELRRQIYEEYFRTDEIYNIHLVTLDRFSKKATRNRQNLYRV